MKVLFLPNNISSISTSTVEALNNLPGIEAKGFYINKFTHQYAGGEHNYFFEGISRKRYPLKWIRQEIKRHFLFRRLIKWADIIHWVYDDMGLKESEKKILRINRKPSVVEWVGSDIRNPDILFPANRYYKEVFYNGYEYAFYESAEQSHKNQMKFSDYGSYPLVNPEMDIYVEKNLFPKRFYVWPRLLLDTFHPQYPPLEKKKLLILHSPSAKFAKGTNFILPVVEELKKEFDFEFKLLHKIPRHEVLQLMQQCDIFIDQVILGMYGLASCEAMAYGKPVLCYLMPAVFENGLPNDCPIVNTTVESLKEKLIDLISNPQLRHDTGKASRAYTEKYFDASKNSRQLVEIYNEVIEAVRKKI